MSSSIKDFPRDTRGHGGMPPGQEGRVPRGGAGGIVPPGHPSQQPRGAEPQLPNTPTPTTTTPTQSPPVVAQPQAPAPAPELPADAFRPPAVDTTVADTDLRGETPTFKRPVTQLAPDLRPVRTLPDVQTRFGADYQMVARHLVQVPDAEPPERAQRAFEYFTKYAERFVEIHTGEERPPETKGPANPEEVPENAPGDELPPELQAKDAKKDPKQVDGKELKDGKEPKEGKDPKGGKEVREERPRSRLERLERLEQQPPGEKERAQEGRIARETRRGDDALLQKLKELPPLPLYKEGEKKAFAQEFSQALKDVAFHQLHDAHSGKDGVATAYELLTSASLKELQQKVEKLKITAQGEWPPPPPTPKSEELVRDQSQRKRAGQEFTGAPLVLKEIGESPSKLSNLQAAEHKRDGVELRVNTLAAEQAKPVIVARDQTELRDHTVGTDADPRRRNNKKLGGNMLWNVLHGYRKEGPDTAEEQAKWDRLSFGAMLFLIMVTLMAVVLVAM